MQERVAGQMTIEVSQKNKLLPFLPEVHRTPLILCNRIQEGVVQEIVQEILHKQGNDFQKEGYEWHLKSVLSKRVAASSRYSPISLREI